MDWPHVFAVLGGNATLLAAAVWLTQKLLSHRFAQELAKYKSDLKTKTDTEIARVSAFLARGSHVHERQVDVLVTLYSQLWEALGHLQNAARAGRLGQEPSPDEDYRLWANSVADAVRTLSKSRVLIPRELATKCDQFVDGLFQGQRYLAFAAHREIADTLQRAEFREKGAKAAYEQIPQLLEEICDGAQTIIHLNV
jgi:hypothetical protein